MRTTLNCVKGGTRSTPVLVIRLPSLDWEGRVWTRSLGPGLDVVGAGTLSRPTFIPEGMHRSPRLNPGVKAPPLPKTGLLAPTGLCFAQKTLCQAHCTTVHNNHPQPRQNKICAMCANFTTIHDVQTMKAKTHHGACNAHCTVQWSPCCQPLCMYDNLMTTTRKHCTLVQPCGCT